MQTRSKPASHLQRLDRKLEWSQTFWPTLGGEYAHTRTMRIQTGERTWHFRMACRSAASLYASRLHAIDGKMKVSEGFGPLWAERMRTHVPYTSRLRKKLGILEWPKTPSADSRQACESFASDRWQTEIVRRFWPSLGGAYALSRAVCIQTRERTWHFRMA